MWQPRSWFGDTYGDGNERVRGVTLSAIVRRRFFTGSPRLQAYVEAAIGPMWAEKQIPAATSQFNVVSSLVVGMTMRR